MEKRVKFKNEVLINIRKEKGLSQEDLASLIDVSRQTISKWESGEKIPDLDNINKLCQKFEVDIDQLVDGIYKQERNYKNNKKTNILKKVLIIIIIVYMMTVLPKAVLFSYILYKNDMKHIKSYTYCYNESISVKDKKTGKNSYGGGSRIVFYKDNIEHIIESYGIEDRYNSDTESWMFEKNNEYYKYGKITTFENNIEREYYDYHTGALYKDNTPFEEVMSYKYKLNIIQILNPFRFYKINDEGEMIIPLGEQDSRLYIDIKTGYLNKSVFIQNDISNERVYMGYEVNDIEDSQVELKEEIKNKIIENSKNNDMNFSDIY